MTSDDIAKSPYRRPAVQIISYLTNNIICSSADSSYDDWIDDGEVYNSDSSISVI